MRSRQHIRLSSRRDGLNAHAKCTIIAFFMPCTAPPLVLYICCIIINIFVRIRRVHSRLCPTARLYYIYINPKQMDTPLQNGRVCSVCCPRWGSPYIYDELESKVPLIFVHHTYPLWCTAFLLVVLHIFVERQVDIYIYISLCQSFDLLSLNAILIFVFAGSPCFGEHTNFVQVIQLRKGINAFCPRCAAIYGCRRALFSRVDDRNVYYILV